MELELSPRQKNTVGIALTMLSALVIIGIVLAIAWLLIRFVSAFASVFLPLAVAMVLALVLKPYFDLYRVKWKVNPVLSVIAVYMTLFIPLLLFSLFFGALLIGQGAELIGKIPELSENVRQSAQERWPQVQEYWQQYGLTEKLQAFLGEKGDSLLTFGRTALSSTMSAGASAFSVVAGSLSWVVLPIYLAFFLMTPTMPKHTLDDYLPFLKPDTRKDVVYLVNEFVNILVSFFRGQLIVAIAQGLLFAVGFMLIGLKYGFIIGFVLGLLNIIPYLGSMVGLGVALPLALFQNEGGWVLLGLVLMVFIMVQCIEGYVLTPRVMGERTGLHPLAIIVAIFFWGTAFDGLMGMILAIPLTAFLVVFWRLAKHRYIKEMF